MSVIEGARRAYWGLKGAVHMEDPWIYAKKHRKTANPSLGSMLELSEFVVPPEHFCLGDLSGEARFAANIMELKDKEDVQKLLDHIERNQLIGKVGDGRGGLTFSPDGWRVFSAMSYIYSLTQELETVASTTKAALGADPLARMLPVILKVVPQETAPKPQRIPSPKRVRVVHPIPKSVPETPNQVQSDRIAEKDILKEWDREKIIAALGTIPSNHDLISSQQLPPEVERLLKYILAASFGKQYQGVGYDDDLTNGNARKGLEITQQVLIQKTEITNLNELRDFLIHRLKGSKKA